MSARTSKLDDSSYTFNLTPPLYLFTTFIHSDIEIFITDKRLVVAVSWGSLCSLKHSEFYG